MSYHDQKFEGKVVEYHRDTNRLPFNPGPATKSRKAKSRIMVPGMHRTHPRRFA